MFKPQNFSIPAGYNEVVTFDLDPGTLLDAATIWWRVYEQQFGIPVTGVPPIIEKSGSDIIALESPGSLMVQMYTPDTIGLLRNYYHEATILKSDGEAIGGVFGIMTVTATENRQSGVLS